jgi:hypothetical protein
MKFSFKQFNQIKKEAKKSYALINKVKCPYFSDFVLFNSKGMQHLKFKSWNKTRSIQDQFMRFKLLKYAPEIIKNSHTLQEYSERKNMERIKINSRWEIRAVKVCYFGFVAILDGIRIKIIIKQIEGGEKYFWSIIPCWKQDRSIFNKKILHEGDLEKD